MLPKIEIQLTILRLLNSLLIRQKLFSSVWFNNENGYCEKRNVVSLAL